MRLTYYNGPVAEGDDREKRHRRSIYPPRCNELQRAKTSDNMKQIYDRDKT